MEQSKHYLNDVKEKEISTEGVHRDMLIGLEMLSEYGRHRCRGRGYVYPTSRTMIPTFIFEKLIDICLTTWPFDYRLFCLAR